MWLTFSVIIHCYYIQYLLLKLQYVYVINKLNGQLPARACTYTSSNAQIHHFSTTPSMQHSGDVHTAKFYFEEHDCGRTCRSTHVGLRNAINLAKY